MGRSTATAIVGLARSGAGERTTAWHHRDALVAAAVALVRAAAHDPDRASCSDAACGLQDPDLCDAAHRLSRLPGAPPEAGAPTLTAATARFVEALAVSADAIRHCRQTVHPGSACWFSPDPAVDGCGAVLRLLHRLA